MKYLGFLKNIDLENFSIQKRNKLLVDKGLYSETLSFSIPKDGLINAFPNNNGETVVEPSKQLCDDFYTFILNKYEKQIAAFFIDFSYTFNNEVYGLEDFEKKRIALRYFKTYVGEVTKSNIPFTKLQEPTTGIDIIENQQKFEMLYDKQNMLKINLAANEELVFNYLKGMEDFFNHELLKNVKILEGVIYFESRLKMILSLNEQFSFEENSFFTEEQIEKDYQEPPITIKPPKRVKNKPFVSDEAAIEYLLLNVFNHQ